MSPNDIRIVCSAISVGKALCMHRGIARICLHLHQYPCQLFSSTTQEPCCVFHNPNFELVTLTLVSKIHEDVDIVLGIKNVFKLEGIIKCCFSFLNRLVPIFPKERIILKSREHKLVKIEAPFLDEISGLTIAKFLDKTTQSVTVLKV